MDLDFLWIEGVDPSPEVVGGEYGVSFGNHVLYQQSHLAIESSTGKISFGQIKINIKLPSFLPLLTLTGIVVPDDLDKPWIGHHLQTASVPCQLAQPAVVTSLTTHSAY